MARRQSLAPFCATALENETPAFGAHALTKTMRFSATTIVWLISSLHSNHPWVMYRCLKTVRLTTAFYYVKEANGCAAAFSVN